MSNGDAAYRLGVMSVTVAGDVGAVRAGSRARPSVRRTHAGVRKASCVV